jgi:hypothetical protein
MFAWPLNFLSSSASGPRRSVAAGPSSSSRTARRASGLLHRGQVREADGARERRWATAGRLACSSLLRVSGTAALGVWHCSSRCGRWGRPSACSLGLSAISQQYFSLRTNQPPPTNQQYSSLRTNQHQPSATSQPNRLHARATHPSFAR